MLKNLDAILKAAALTTTVSAVAIAGGCTEDDKDTETMGTTAGCPGTTAGTTAGCPGTTAGTTAGCPGTTAGCPGTTAGCPGTTAGCPGTTTAGTTTGGANGDPSCQAECHQSVDPGACAARCVDLKG